MLTTGLILILASLGLAQGLFLSFYLLTLKKGNKASNIFLALFLLGLTIRIGKSVLNYYIPLENWQNNIGISGILFAAPSLWFYGITLFENNRLFSIRDYVHFVPFILFLFLVPFVPRNGRFEAFWNYGIIVFHFLVYLILSWSYLYKNRMKASKSIVQWYRNILIGSTLIWFHYVGNLFDFTIYYIIGPIFYSFLIYAFSYLFLNRHKFNLQKYSSSKLNRNRSLVLFQKVQELFETEHTFLDEGLTLYVVSKKLNVKAREISQVINENTQQNFYEFVNQYRIEKAKLLLKDSKYVNEKIAAIAYDSGFGNVTSFNVSFKKKTGLTPSAYRKK
ncbi:helix-turn-helix domain-containing protein [Flagellimonas hymeniacidonis]|uniref:Helix-turn-helix domain-containing protein n=1 Tax=Flagellimonas hymeniacidonis TaxID=2603628 RepID=A0A5C8V6H8_9FLAO|nr:helix-turn-helix domain-containing protein [Flagellimonas hymeniacidonis]TXN37302.1 helix-turn-helix domain-containing protein [Flagellimonas hymeniacidonis]